MGIVALFMPRTGSLCLGRIPVGNRRSGWSLSANPWLLLREYEGLPDAGTSIVSSGASSAGGSPAGSAI